MAESTVLETERLRLRCFHKKDDAFILQLLNDPEWIRFIGDLSVRTAKQARDYLKVRLIPDYKSLGYGLYLVESKRNRQPLGICGFVKRTFLQHPDLGFAFLPEYRRHGYAFEAAEACLMMGRRELGFTTILAITSPDNHVSGELLQKLGFRRQGEVVGDRSPEELFLYSSTP